MEATETTQVLGVVTSLLATLLLYCCTLTIRPMPKLDSEVRTISVMMQSSTSALPHQAHSFQQLATTEEVRPSSMTPIRAFDLGGSGFKTMRYVYNRATNRMIPQNADVQNLGRCTNYSTADEPTSCALWLRTQLPSLNQEVQSGHLFAFSLSGLGKLFPDGKWHGSKWGGGRDRSSVRFDASTMANLFDLPKDRVFSTGDGEAHLLATVNSMHHLRHPVINFALGTGLALAMSNSKGQVLNGSSLLCWATGGEKVSNRRAVQIVLRVTDDFDESRSIGPAGRAAALQALGADVYKERWGKFLTEVVLPLFDGDKWPMPGAVVFTGGVVDGLGQKILPTLPNPIALRSQTTAQNDGSLTSAVEPPAHNLRRFLRGSHDSYDPAAKHVQPPVVLQGPRNAGLLGAAWLAAKGGAEYEALNSELGSCVERA